MFDNYDDEPLMSAREEREFRDRYARSAVGTKSIPARGWETTAEHEFATEFAKYLSEDASLYKGGPTSTAVNRQFSPNMVLAYPSHRIGLEIDRRGFRNDLIYDDLRDTALLMSGTITRIYRFAASSQWFRVENFAFGVMRYEPAAFDLRAREVLLPTLASQRVRTLESFGEHGIEIFGDLPDESHFDGNAAPKLEPMYFTISRFSLKAHVAQRTQAWIERALRQFGPTVPFEHLLDRYRAARAAA